MRAGDRLAAPGIVLPRHLRDDLRQDDLLQHRGGRLVQRAVRREVGPLRRCCIGQRNKLQQQGRCRPGPLAQVFDDLVRRHDHVALPTGCWRYVRSELHRPVAETAFGNGPAAQDLDVGVPRVLSDRAHDTLDAVRRSLEPLEEPAIVIQHQPGDRLAVVSRLRPQRQLVQLLWRERLRRPALIHQCR